jgi:hypothetical protein
MGENRPLTAAGMPPTAKDLARWPAHLTARQLLRAADGLALIAATCHGRMRDDLEREAAELRHRAWRVGPRQSDS